MKSITLPNSLKTIEEDVFLQCESLNNIVFPNALEKIGLFAFYKSGLENVKFPTSLREIAQGAFAECTSLETVEFGEGLEVLGTDEYPNEGGVWSGLFEGSTLENVKLPSTLKRIEYNIFSGCKNLRNICLPERLEYIGKKCFCRSALVSIRLPSALKAVE